MRLWSQLLVEFTYRYGTWNHRALRTASGSHSFGESWLQFGHSREAVESLCWRRRPPVCVGLQFGHSREAVESTPTRDTRGAMR